MNKAKLLNLCLFIPLVLTFQGCSSGTNYITANDPGTATIRIYKDNNSTSKDRYIPPKNVKIKLTYNDLSGALSNNENVCPSIGNVNLLVIPVHVKGEEKYKTDAIRSDIEKVFFSEGDSRMGFPSVKEYYKESSFGKLNFQGKVTDWYDSNFTASEITQDYVDDNGVMRSGTIKGKILRDAVDWATKTQGINLKDYDLNDDGSIDAVWLVYDHLDWDSDLRLKLKADPSHSLNDFNSAFWNFTGWDYDTEPAETPTTSGFSWASFDMMYTSYCKRDEMEVPIFDDFSSIPLDSHTFIHETGHLLGLDDYYAGDDSYYHPAGQSTMMDQNICDLDSYSKMLLGWVTPYVVYGTSEIVIPTASSSDHAVIVIPYNFEKISDEIEKMHNSNASFDNYIYEFSPFSEYIMIDLYSPEGLNNKDVYGRNANDGFGEYVIEREQGMSKTGVRIYHIDSRIFKCEVTDIDGGQILTYVDGYVWDERRLANNEAILMPISNQKSEESFQLPSDFNMFDQIRLLEAGGQNTFDYNEYATNESLWTTSSDPFDIVTFGYQFFNGRYTFNNGEDLPFKIKVTTLKEVN